MPFILGFGFGHVIKLGQMGETKGLFSDIGREDFSTRLANYREIMELELQFHARREVEVSIQEAEEEVLANQESLDIDEEDPRIKKLARSCILHTFIPRFG